MKNPVVTSGSTTCAEPGCRIAIVPMVGKRGPRFCGAHTPDLYDEPRAIDVAPLRGRVTAPERGDDDAA